MALRLLDKTGVVGVETTHAQREHRATLLVETGVARPHAQNREIRVRRTAEHNAGDVSLGKLGLADRERGVVIIGVEERTSRACGKGAGQLRFRVRDVLAASRAARYGSRRRW